MLIFGTPFSSISALRAQASSGLRAIILWDSVLSNHWDSVLITETPCLGDAEGRSSLYIACASNALEVTKGLEYLGEGGWSTWERGWSTWERGVGVPGRGVGVPGRGGLEYLGEGISMRN